MIFYVKSNILLILSRLFVKEVVMSHYAVRVGKKPGVYSTWVECEEQVKKFPMARYKKFPSIEQAWEFVRGGDTNETNTMTLTTSPEFSNRNNSFHTNSHGNASNTTNSTKCPINYKPNSCGVPNVANQQMGRIQHCASSLQLQTRQLHTWDVSNEAKFKISEIETLCNLVKQRCDELDTLLQKGKLLNSPKRSGSKLYNEEDVTTNKKRKSSNSGDNSIDYVVVYTDGSCFANGRHGACAGIGVYWGPGDNRNFSERLPGRQTNNRAEIHAACKAIEQAKDVGLTDLEIRTDSAFMINSITKWIHKWKRNGWKLVSGADVVNREDFERLDMLSLGINIKWTHVRGHCGILGNEAADKLANEGARKCAD